MKLQLCFFLKKTSLDFRMGLISQLWNSECRQNLFFRHALAHIYDIETAGSVMKLKLSICVFLKKNSVTTETLFICYQKK